MLVGAVGLLMTAVVVPAAWSVRNHQITPAGSGTPLNSSSDSDSRGGEGVPPQDQASSSAALGSSDTDSATSDTDSATSDTDSATSDTGSATFVAVAGDGCRRSVTRGYDKVGVFAEGSDGADGWYTHDRGGWNGDGCQGSLTSVPMSGSPTRDQSAQYVMWWFVTRPVQTGQCQIWIYVPTTGIARDVAGRPAFYQVLAGRADSTKVGAFAIDQDIARGSWVDAGSYPLRNGQIAVKMTNRGVLQGKRHLGAAQARVRCEGS